MAQIGPALEFTFVNEGGYTVDNGGPTNFGVTQNTLDAANKKRPKAGYPKDVRKLTREQAADIYKNDFLPACYGDIQSQRVGTLLFDMGVNSGLQEAIVLMQKAVNACGVNPSLVVDGNMGPKTVAAMNALDADLLCTAYSNQRVTFYNYLYTKNPALYGPNIRGWLIRARRFPPADQPSTAPVAPDEQTA